MRRIISLLLVLFWAVPVFGEDLPEGVFPWGVYSDYRESSAERDSMRDTLGLNLVFLAWDWTRPPSHIVDFMNDDMVVYPNQGPVINPSDSTNYFVYAEAHYSMIYANDDSSQVRFHERNSYGSDPLYGFFPCDSIAVNETLLVLGNLWFKQEEDGALPDQSPIRYYRALSMRIDTDDVSANDTVAFLVTLNWDSDVTHDNSVIDTLFITAGQFSDEVPDTLELAYYNRGEEAYTGFEIYSTCKTEVYFEFLKIYCEFGKNLIDDGRYDAGIYSSATYLFGGENVAGWHMSDEPFYDNFLPLWYIDSLIMVATSGFDDIPRAVTDWSIASAGEYTRDFIQIAKPEVVWADPYQFYGGQEVDCEGDTVKYWLFVDYAGGDTYYGAAPPHWGLQKSLRKKLSEPAEIIRAACADAGIDWWFVVQAFSWYFLDCPPCDYDENPAWRMPTQSELSCIIYMGLCYDARGIVFYHYHAHSDTNGDWPDRYTEGFKDLDGNYTSAWYGAQEANHYMKAIDDTYLGLTWDDAYYIDPESAMPGGWIDTIYAVSNDTLPNQDLGWFHVGQYTEGSDKYVMIVNRACSQDSITPDPAPSITATVKFDTNDLGLGNYVYIIDIADSVDYISYDSVLVFPETTFASSSGGLITFSTEFGPGEGRLFKLVEVDANLPNPVTDSVNVAEGQYIFHEDWVVHDSGVLVLEAGVKIYTDSLVGILCDGKIYANGTSSDSIWFLPYSDSSSAGDWIGIYLGNDAVGSFSYCSIRYAADGLEMRNDTEVSISHSSISDCKMSGIYNYKGYLTLTESAISNNVIYGLNAVDAADSVTNTIFHLNDSYGIKISGSTSSNDESYLIENSITHDSGGNGSQYGIYVKDNDYVTIENCTVKYYGQGLIRLDGSDVEMTDCDLIGYYGYGVYAENASEPAITSTVFDEMAVGVKAVGGANPVLGIEPDTSNNAFYDCADYFVYFANISSEYEDTLWAQNCWWNREEPDPGMFYSDAKSRVIIYEPWLDSDPSPKLATQIPLKFELNQNYPNPFNPNTIISFSLEQSSKTIVTIYNILGQKVAAPVNEYLEAGNHSIIWDGKNSSGSPVASGVYFYTIQSGDHFASKKMLLLR